MAEPTDEEILAALDEADPQPQDEPTDDDILAALDEADPIEQGPRRRGIVESLPGGSNLVPPRGKELAARFGAQAVGRAASVGVSLFNIAQKVWPGEQEPVRFSSRDLVGRLERANVLGEARALERISEKAGDSFAFATTASAATAGLVAAGVPSLVAGATGLVGTTMLDMFQEGKAANVDISNADYAKAAAWSLALLPVGKVAGDAIIRETTRLLKRPLGKAAEEAVRNAALGGIFEGGGALVADDPRWYEAAAGGIVGFMGGAGFDSYFPGKTKPRTKAQIEKAVKTVGAAIDEFQIGTRGAATAETSEQARVMAEFRYQHAENAYMDSQALLGARELTGKKAREAAKAQALRVQKHFDVEAGEPIGAARPEAPPGAIDVSRTARQKKLETIVEPSEAQRLVEGRSAPRATRADRLATERRMVEEFGVTPEEAHRIAQRRLTRDEVREILANKTEEGIILAAEERGLPVLYETMYRLNLMPDPMRKVYEASRQRFTPEEIDFLSQNIPTAEEGRQRAIELEQSAEADIAAMEAELAPTPVPGGVQTRSRGVAVAEQIARRRAATEDAATQAQERKRAARESGLRESMTRAAKGLRVPVKPEFPPPKPPEPRGLVRQQAPYRQRSAAIEKQVQGLRRVGLKPVQESAGVAPRFPETRGPLRPKPLPPGEREASGEKPGSAVQGFVELPRPAAEATVGEVLDARPQVIAELAKRIREVAATPAPIAQDAVARAQQLLGEKAQVSPPAPARKVSPEKIDRARARSAAIVEKATAKLEADNARRARLRPKLRPGEKDALFYGGAALAAAGAATLASKADDAEDESLLLNAGLPVVALMFMRGRKLPPGERWALKIAAAERKEAVRKEVEPRIETLLARGGKPGPRQAVQVAEELSKALPKIPAPVEKWDASQKEIVARTIGNQIARSGPEGDALNRLMQDMVVEKLQIEGHYHDRMKNIDVGEFRMKPDVPLPDAERKKLNLLMDHVLGEPEPGTTRPQFAELSDAAKVQFVDAMQHYFGHETGDARLDGPARAYGDFQRKLYADFEAQSLNDLVAWMPYHAEDGVGYRPLPFREEVFLPDQLLATTNPAEFRRRTNEMNRLRDLIAADEGQPRWVIDKAFDGVQGIDRDGPLFNRGLNDLEVRKSGNIDYHRFFKTRHGRDWDATKAAKRYIDQAATRLSYVRRFGQDGSVARELINEAARSGNWNREQLVQMFDAGTLQQVNISGALGKYATPFTREMMAATGFRHLGGFALSNLVGGALIPQHVGRNYAQGFARTWGSAKQAIRASIDQSTILPKSFKKQFGDRLQAEFVADAGALTQHVHIEMLAGQKGFMPKILSGYLKFGGGAIDRYWRNLAAISADKYFQKLYEEMRSAKLRGMDDVVENRRLHFRELFEDPLHRRMAEDPNLSPDELIFLRKMAAHMVAKRTQNRTTPIDMPLLASDDLGRPLYALSSYGIRQTAEFNRQIMESMQNPAVRNRVIAGWLAATGTAFGVLQLQKLRRGQDVFDPEKDPLAREILESLTYAGIGPVYYDTVVDALGEHGNPVANISPVVKDLLEFGQTIPASRAEGNIKPVGRYLIRGLPRVIPQQAALPDALLPRDRRPKKPKESARPKRPK